MGTTFTGLSGKKASDFGHGKASLITYMNVFSNPIANPNMIENVEVDSRQREVEVGDVFFTTSSETPEEVGMSSVLKKKIGITYLNSFCFGFRPSVKFDLDYLAFMLRSESVRKQIKLLAQGISRFNIAKTKMMYIDIQVPKIDEQIAIGKYFAQLDRLITLHQCNCNMATRPCEWSSGLRAIAWEQRKLGEIVKIRRGLTYKPSDICENGIRVLRSSNIDGDSFVLNCDDVFVREQAVNIDYARENDILITAANGSSRLVGKHAILSQIPDKSTVHGGFMLLGSTEEPYFINASMGSSWYRRFVELFVAGGNGAIGNLNKNDLDNQDIFVPSKKEQARIGAFFRHLDRLVALHQRKHILLT